MGCIEGFDSTRDAFIGRLDRKDEKGLMLFCPRDYFTVPYYLFLIGSLNIVRLMFVQSKGLARTLIILCRDFSPRFNVT